MVGTELTSYKMSSACHMGLSHTDAHTQSSNYGLAYSTLQAQVEG